MNFSRFTGRMFAFLWELKDNDRNPYYGIACDELSLDRRELDKISFDRLSKILDYAWRNSRHYQSRFAEWGVRPQDFKSFDDLRRFPCLTRDDLRLHMEDISAEVSNRSTWTKSATGGTTSSPVSYYRDRNSTWRRWADSRIIDGWYGYTIGDRKACLWGAEQDYSGKPSLGMRLRNVMYERSIMLPSAPLDEEVLENHLQRLDKWQPTFLQAFPSPLYEFCLFLKAKNLRLPYLRGVSVTAEPLYSHHRELIEEVLGFKIFNWYGSRELGRVASECECHNGLHINEPSIYVEVEQDPSLPDGFGHLIVTDLWNRATPFIRYRTGDIARIVMGECSCGRALKRVAAIEGRLTDMIVMPGGRKITGIVMASRLATNPSEITERQIIQEGLGNFRIRYVKGSNFRVSSLDSLKENLFKLLDSKVSILFEEVTEIPRERSGKIRFVKCEIEDADVSLLTSSKGQGEDFHV